MKKPLALVGLLIIGGFSAAMAATLAQNAPSRSTLNGVFSEAQAKRGEDAYLGSCAQCHGENLITVDAETPSLTGPRFKSEWMGKTLAERFELIRTTMPATNPGNLSDQANIDILAFILKFNGYPAGQQELTADRGVLEKIVVEPAL